MSRLPGALLALLGLGAGLAGCADEADRYCAEVEDQQEALTAAVAAGGPGALLEVLPNLERLRERSPGDLRDEWDTVVTRLQNLQDALDAAGLRPEDYEAQGVNPASLRADGAPDDVTEQERTAIEAAARELATPQMLEALEGVQQQALDVCGTPLTR